VEEGKVEIEQEEGCLGLQLLNVVEVGRAEEGEEGAVELVEGENGEVEVSL
jgi:hypothetical protein